MVVLRSVWGSSLSLIRGGVGIVVDGGVPKFAERGQAVCARGMKERRSHAGRGCFGESAFKTYPVCLS